MLFEKVQSKNACVMGPLSVIIIINFIFILGKNTKYLQLYRYEINVIKFFNNQATAKLLGIFTPRQKPLYISCKEGA